MNTKKITALLTSFCLCSLSLTSGLSGSDVAVAEDSSIEAPFGCVTVTGYVDAEGNPTTLEEIEAAVDAEAGQMLYTWEFNAQDVLDAAGLSGSLDRFTFGVYATGTTSSGEAF